MLDTSEGMKTMLKLQGIVLAAMLGTSIAANATATDVSLGANVTEVGSTFGQSPGWGTGVLAAPNAITNGTFLPIGNQWDTNTVYWTSTSSYLQVNLNGNYNIGNVVLEADNNDSYQISYLHNGTWTTLADLSPTISGTVNGNGTINQTGSVSWGLGLNGVGQSITTSSFRIQAVSGDSSYGVGQFQAYGTPAPVPEPSTSMMMGVGIVGLVLLRRRFKARVA